MPFAIGYIFYGVPFTIDYHQFDPTIAKAMFDVCRSGSDEFDDYESWEDPAFLDILPELAEEYDFDTAYSGSGDIPIWFGINLGIIDECGDIRVKDIPVKTAKHERLFEEKCQRLPLGIREAVLAADRDTWIKWGSS